MQLVDFSKLTDMPTHKDVNVKSLGGTVRIVKLTALQTLPILTAREGFDATEDGKLANDDDVLWFATEMVAKSVVDEDGNLQLDTDEGREFLKTSYAIWELFPHVRELNGLDADPAKKKTE